MSEQSLESCIVALVQALQQSKGWLHDYADSVVRDAVDRGHLEGEPLKVAAYRVDWPAEIGIAPGRFYGADDAHRMNCHISYVQGTGPTPIPLVRLSDAEAEIAALREDAERLDWLIRQDNCVVSEGTSGFWLSWTDEHDSAHTEYQKGSYPTARAAIDAARAAQEVKP